MTCSQPDLDGRLVGLDWIADRWSVSRTTAARVLSKHDARAHLLSGAKRGVRRYRLAEVLAIEEACRA